MLLNSYFSVDSIENTESGDVVKISLNPNHDVYNGHFPGMPVCPGVCSVQTIRECAELITKRKLRISSLGQVKFTSLITPAENPKLNISLSISDADENTKKIKATITNDEGTSFLSLKGDLSIVE